MNTLFNGIYNNKRVMVTGHTGFKGSWLVYWLEQLGANVIGYSLGAPTIPNHFELLQSDIVSIHGNITDQIKLDKVFARYRPEIVFHLAAQSLVRCSYLDPVKTYETNVIGTLKVLEASKKCSSVKAIVNVTSDKAYNNVEQIWGYKENDPMGGFDPYSSSKGCAELLVSSYRDSYFSLDDYTVKHQVLLASCRAGNVVGGGDWAKDRLIADIMVAASQGEKVNIRAPESTRPWQHVLEPISGYLVLGQKLLEGKKEFAEGWNYGPSLDGAISVMDVVNSVKSHWDKIGYELTRNDEQPHEMKLLRLDCSKAQVKLKWQAVWGNKKTFERTANWYKYYYEEGKILTQEDLNCYISDAKTKQLGWSL